ncbi:MAG: hypothetical protein AOA65_2303 [Candidatus Bathyarchaeota archaeon BA1]|nr:MAG: hypothetical protein AOA65_2303 [Candidatus Bathyarchaeota archaeon BA1]
MSTYDELYEAWMKEKEGGEIQALPRDFYARLANYVRKMREESRMLDEKTTRARLMRREFENVQRMVKDLIRLRHEKALRGAMAGKIVPRGTFTEEEERLHGRILPSVESYQTLLKDVIRGQLPQVEEEEKPKTMMVRFLREIPAIIGSDMKTYGPFKSEDIATLPIENARILIKQGVAVEVEAKL